MWRILGRTAHLWSFWFYKLVSNAHTKIIKFNHTRIGEWILGDKILLLETIGIKSKKVRKTPLTYVFYNGAYVVAASYSGNEKTPDWFYNLNSGDVFITVDSVRLKVNPELISHDQKSFYWNLLDEHYPTFKQYRDRSNRDIPLIKLTKV